MRIFIEFWKAKDAWYDLSKRKREDFVVQIGPAMADLISEGVIVDAWGTNDDSSPYKADYDFFAITKFPSGDLLEKFQEIVETSGWYNYFEQINVSGQDLGTETVIGRMIDLKKEQVMIEKNI
ncbi:MULTISPECIES: DUF6616 family protein [unclassified Saccharicrinis]|uniref:DUF6616 family protein n=1 Tax=unclassified Saccharicrinis TaxID=2646859 RepID=UPI003D333C15